MLILQQIKSTFALAFSTMLLSSGLVSCGSNGGSGLIPSTSQTQIRSLRSVSTATPWGSNTCVSSSPSHSNCYLAFGGSVSINLPVQQIAPVSPGEYNCQGSWSPDWYPNSQLTSLSATFSKQSGNGGCGSNVSATITFHDSLPASTPESKWYIADSGPAYQYTWCLPANEGGCGTLPTAANGFIAITIYVDAPQTPTPTPSPPCAISTPGPNLLKEIPVTDKNGKQIISASGFPLIRPDDGNDPSSFAAEGALAANNFNNLDLNSAINSLYNFQQGGKWDEQRVGGDGVHITDPNFIDWSTVDIGIFAAAAGIPEEVMQRLQEVYAIKHSKFGKYIKTQAGYPGIPQRNIENMDLGYKLYNSGVLKITLCLG